LNQLRRIKYQRLVNYRCCTAVYTARASTPVAESTAAQCAVRWLSRCSARAVYQPSRSAY